MKGGVTTAMVLAAGLGIRMRPLTDALPKPLVPLLGRPLIDHVLDRIADAGIARAVVNVHYQADLIERHLANRRHPRIAISDERDALLDTGGGVARALPLLGAGPFLIHNADCVWIEGPGSNLDRLIASFDVERMDSLMLLASPAGSLGYSGLGDFVMDEQGLIRRRGEHDNGACAFTGVSIAHPRMFAPAPAGRFSLNRLWDQAIAAGRLFGLPMQGVWMHVGTPHALTAAEQRMSADASA